MGKKRIISFLKKGGFAIASLFAMATLTFVMMKALPGDPFTEEKALPAETLYQLNKVWGLDEPWYTQYFSYIQRLVSFDLGPSIVYPNRTVGQIIETTFPVSASIGLQAISISLLGGIFLGILSAICTNWQIQKVLFLLGILAVSIPSFILSTFLQYFFAIEYHILPIAGWGSFADTILPTLSLAAFPMAVIARLVRKNLLETYQSDFIKNARAKGLSSREILFYHALPNSVLPAMSYLGQLGTAILTGSFIIEKIYGIPGLGKWYVASVINRDYPVIMGVTIFYSAIMIIFSLATDFCYTLIDPRIHEHE